MQVGYDATRLRPSDVVLLCIGEKETGIHISFFDMGGQPLVVSYLRVSSLVCTRTVSHCMLYVSSHSIFSIFFRMDEVLAEINSASSDLPKRTHSRLTALQELHVWLDAVPASTTYGPVMLVAHIWGCSSGREQPQEDLRSYLL